MAFKFLQNIRLIKELSAELNKVKHDNEVLNFQVKELTKLETNHTEIDKALEELKALILEFKQRSGV
jgi:predicted transcriptional regulator